MTLTVLSIAYPLAPVGRDAVGGAEQILSALDAALVESGHNSLVIALEDSQIAGRLIALPRMTGPFNASAIGEAREACRRAVAAVLAETQVDLIHMHGVDFYEYLPPPGPPVLATLHLPVSWYPEHVLFPQRPLTWLNCVSRSQHETCRQSANLLPPIVNGIAVPPAAPLRRKRNYVLALARICPEKGLHLALDAARQAHVPMILAGRVFPYREHEDYFIQMIKPRLGFARRYIGPVGFDRKARLLAEARCLLISSLVPETSSLAALEALANGTPVVALRRGALPEAVDHGRTGFLAEDLGELVEGIRAARDIDAETCRAHVRDRFSLDKMIADYFAVYHRLAASGRRQQFANRTAVA